MDDLQRNALQAIKLFLTSVTIPLLFDVNEYSLDQLGTGTLFEFQDGHALVTARHVLDGIDPERFAVPERPRGPRTLTLGKIEIVRFDDPPGMDIDVAIIKLKDPDLVTLLKSGGWTFLTPSSTAAPSKSGKFLLCGFPSAKLSPRDKGLSAAMLSVLTDRLPSPPNDAAQPVHDRLDIFFRYDKGSYDLDGRLVNEIGLHGLSGSSVWEISEQLWSKPFWTPNRDLKVVAIQTSVKAGFARAKNWAAVRELYNRSAT